MPVKWAVDHTKDYFPAVPPLFDYSVSTILCPWNLGSGQAGAG